MRHSNLVLIGVLFLMPTPTTAAPIYIDKWDHAALAFDRGQAYLDHELHDTYVKLRGDITADTLAIERFEVWGVGRQALGFSIPPLTLALLPDANPLITSKHAWANVGGYDYRFEVYQHKLVRFMAIDRATGRQMFPPTTFASGAMFSYYFGMARSGAAPEPSGLTMIVAALLTLCVRRV